MANPKSVPGSTLIAELLNEMKKREETPHDLAKHLGISYAYLMALARGERPIPQIARPILEASAKYLRLPVAHAFLMADALSPDDFCYAPDLNERFDRVHDRILSDPVWCGYAPDRDDWYHLGTKIKMLVSLLYERVGQTQFFAQEDSSPAAR